MANENSTGYEHYIPMVPEDATWESKIKFNLVRSVDEFRKIVEDHKSDKYIAFDTETTGLNFDVDRIVGFSFAFSMYEGWYVPIRHIVGTNLNSKEALDILYNLLMSKVMVFEYNMRFDTRMLEEEGYDMEKCRVFEVQLGVYLSDTNYKRLGLKLAERRWLGWNPDSFTETVGEKENFSYTDPEESFRYAIADSCGTYGVASKVVRFYKEAGVAGRVLNEAMYPFMKFEDIRYEIDKEYLQKCQYELVSKLKELEHEIYNRVGYQFKIGSNVQLGNALQSVGINTGSYTKTGQMKVDIKTFEIVNRTLKSDLLDKLIEYSQLTKLGNSYIDSLLDQGEKKDYKLRFHYILGGTGGSGDQGSAPTGRVSSGADKKNDYFAKINIMAIPKPHSKMYYVHPYKEGDTIKEGDVVILNWRFSLVDKSEYVSEGMDQHLNIRSAFIPPKGWLIVSRDFSAQELRMQAALANAKNWVNTFNTGGDLHMVMAKQIWGEEKYNRDYRKKAKCVTGDTLVYTTRGLIRIDKLCDFREIDKFTSFEEEVFTQDGVETTARFYYGGIQKVRRITFSNGVVLGVTSEHPLYCRDKWVKSGDLKVGDRVDLGIPSGNYNLKYQKVALTNLKGSYIELDEDLAYLCGLIQGDGSINSHSVEFMSTDKELIQEAQRILIKYSISEAQLHNSRQMTVVNCGAKKAVGLFTDIGLFCNGKNSRKVLEVPKCIYTSPITVMGAYLRGLFDTDGTIGKADVRTARISFCSRSELFVRQLQQICFYIGINCSVSEDYNKSYERSYYKLNIFRNSMSKFSEVVGFNQLKKNQRLRDCLALGSIRKTYKDISTIIKKIEETEEPVYDLSLDTKSHSFYSNGIVSHNSLNFGLLYGMSAYTMSERINESVEETKVIINKYWKGCPEIPAYQKACLRKAKKDGTIYTYFGLPRRLRYYLESPSPKLRSFGERSVANTMIQGACSTMTLLAALKMWHKLYNNPEWKDICRFQTYIHDEIVSAVREDKVAEFGLIQKECMEMKFPNLPVKFETSMSIGVSWGNQFDFHYDEKGNLVPDMERVKE